MFHARRTLLALLLLCGAAALALPAAASDWTRFRGPNGTGIAADKDVPVAWTEKEILWKVPLPGAGNSSPIILGERIFLQAEGAGGKDRKLVCLSTKDGKVQWTAAAPGAAAAVNRQFNTRASSTPATDGERVFVLFWDGDKVGLHAFDLDGNLVWQRDLGAFRSEHGPGTSPMVYKDKVIVANDQDGPTAPKPNPNGKSVVFAFDTKTGKPDWQVERPNYRTCYSTPFLLEKPGAAPELIVASTVGITAYNPDDGNEVWNWTWRFSGMRLRTVASPVYSQGLVFAGSGDGSGLRHLVAVKAGGKGDIGDGALVWDNKTPSESAYVPCMLTLGDHLYSVNDKGYAACKVARTGEQVWSEKLGAEVFASPVLVNGNVYAADVAGDVYVFPAAPKFKLLATNSIGEPVFATPAVADNRLYVRGKEHLFCIGKK